MDASGKYVRYTNEQVEALERVYHECPKPSSIRRHQLIKESPILSNIEPKQIKVWFQNRRYAPFTALRRCWGCLAAVVWELSVRGVQCAWIVGSDRHWGGEVVVGLG